VNPLAFEAAARGKQNGGDAVVHKTALEHRSDLSKSWVKYGHSLSEAGRIVAAVDAYRQALIDIPDDAEIYRHLGRALKQMNQTEEAAMALQKADALESSQGTDTIGLREEPVQTGGSATVNQHLDLDKASDDETQVADLKRAYVHLQAERDALKAQVVADLKARHQGAGNTLELDVDGAPDVAAESREMMAAGVARLAALQALCTETQDENEMLRNQVAGQQAEIERQQGRLEEVQALCAVAQDESQKFQDEVPRLQERIEELQALCADVQGRNEALESDAETHLHEISTERDKLKSELEEARAALKALQKETQGQEKRIQQAREDFLRSEGQVNLIRDLVLREGGL